MLLFRIQPSLTFILNIRCKQLLQNIRLADFTSVQLVIIYRFFYGKLTVCQIPQNDRFPIKVSIFTQNFNDKIFMVHV